MGKKVVPLPGEKLIDSNIKTGTRDGTVIEKGIILNEDYLEKHFDDIGDIMSIFSAYPDVYLDLITPTD